MKKIIAAIDKPMLSPSIIERAYKALKVGNIKSFKNIVNFDDNKKVFDYEEELLKYKTGYVDNLNINNFIHIFDLLTQNKTDIYHKEISLWGNDLFFKMRIKNRNHYDSNGRFLHDILNDIYMDGISTDLGGNRTLDMNHTHLFNKLQSSIGFSNEKRDSIYININYQKYLYNTDIQKRLDIIFTNERINIEEKKIYIHKDNNVQISIQQFRQLIAEANNDKEIKTIISEYKPYYEIKY